MNLERKSLKTNVQEDLRKVPADLRTVLTLDSKLPATSNLAGLKTLLMISKHGSPPDLNQLSQYFLIYNKYPLNVDLSSYREAFEFGKRIFKGKHIKGFADGVDIGQQVASNFQSRGFEDNEDLFGRDMDAFDDLEAREPLNIGSAASVSLTIYQQVRTERRSPVI